MVTMKYFIVALVCAVSIQAGYVYGDAPTKCIECIGDENSECAKDTVIESEDIKTCSTVDETVQECISYKNFDAASQTIRIYRGCASATDQCNDLNTNNTIKSCITCAEEDCVPQLSDATEYTLCIQCSGDECPNDEVTIDENTNFNKFDSSSSLQCVAYKYLDLADGKVKYYRGVTDNDGNNCTTQDEKSVTKSCNECKDSDNCNKDFGDATQYTLCVKCADDECPNDEVTVDENTNFDKFDSSSSLQCVAYKYLNVADGKVKYYRGVTDNDGNNCTTQDEKSVTKSCNECKDNDNCNKDFGDAKQYTLCVKCAGDECSNDEVTIDENTNFDKFDNSSSLQCVAYKYLDVADGKVKYYRGVTDNDGNNCTTQDEKSVTKSCNECKDSDNCNKDFGDATQYTLCVKCADDECPNDEVTVDENTNFDKFDSSSSLQCVAYKYLNVADGKVKYYRGVTDNDGNNCTTQDEKSVTKSCNECKDNDNCNKDFGDAKQYTLCVKCAGDECSNDEVTIDENTNFDKFDNSSSLQCVAYKYLDVADGKVKYYRGVTDNDGNNCTTQDEKSVTKSCNECKDSDNCNKDFGDATQYTLCVKCADDECPNDEVTVDENTNFDKFDSSSSLQCVAYKYLNVADGKVKYYRGVTDNDGNNCTTQDEKSVTKSCNECKDSDNCNKDFGDATQYTLCVKCAGDECPNDEITIDENTNFDKFDSSSSLQCVAYKYLDVADETIKYYRGLTDDQENNCKIQNEKSVTKSCNECKDSDNCNKNLGTATQYTLCVDCSGDECPDNDVTINSNTTFCKFDTKSTQQCIAYTYLNTKTNSKTPVYYRGCVEKEEGCEYLSLEDHLTQGTMQTCSECDDTDLCNRNLNGPSTQEPETTTAGAPSIVNFSICLLSMVIGTFLAYIV